ncbi:acyl carrier protein [Frankia sp. AgB1.9]|jgi:acyl carrier protein|uniref:acyl carrier protein n=1 Tax=unclassified Frankia TaxID=2632575 RepID=UPI001EE3DAE6|nr:MULTISPECIES: acyl carrier protein [unclassified Frankia]MBL7491581.1 acyl carrier protein [Frankia sp. AgW1.1]MBL7553173.1 acyl carrier protein [Frankia sp. AgB1.9]
MITIEDFMGLVRDEIGLSISRADLASGFDSVPGWDSVHLLALMMALERRTGRMIPMPDLLEAPSLQHVYQLAVAA